MAEGSTHATLSDGERPNGQAREMLLWVVSDRETREFLLPRGGSVLVGRGPDVDLALSNRRVSRRQARISRTPDLEVEDLGSVNGTFVGSERLSPGERRSLRVGDCVEMGGTFLVVGGVPEPEEASSRSGSASGPDACTNKRGMVCSSKPMQRVLALADRAAQSNISALILGETGVGKDVLAERIHLASPRRAAPLLRLNCAALSPSLLESELFGHEKGAFTGAIASRPGLLRSAHGGTIFLDEIAELPLELQAKLLLVLERREVTPIGSVRPRVIDVRFIAATNCELAERVEEGTFRRDLYFRLDGVTLRIPPLRERVEEIVPLARKFSEEAARLSQRPPPRLGEEAARALEQRSWPGNIRELRSVMERATLLGAGETIALSDVHEPADKRLVSTAVPAFPSECDRIRQVLADCGGNQSRAAKQLGISRNTLIARIKVYQLTRPIGARLVRNSALEPG